MLVWFKSCCSDGESDRISWPLAGRSTPAAVVGATVDFRLLLSSFFGSAMRMRLISSNRRGNGEAERLVKLFIRRRKQDAECEREKSKKSRLQRHDRGKACFIGVYVIVALDIIGMLQSERLISYYFALSCPMKRMTISQTSSS